MCFGALCNLHTPSATLTDEHGAPHGRDERGRGAKSKV